MPRLYSFEASRSPSVAASPYPSETTGSTACQDIESHRFISTVRLEKHPAIQGRCDGEAARAKCRDSIQTRVIHRNWNTMVVVLQSPRPFLAPSTASCISNFLASVGGCINASLVITDFAFHFARFCPRLLLMIQPAIACHVRKSRD